MMVIKYVDTDVWIKNDSDDNDIVPFISEIIAKLFFYARQVFIWNLPVRCQYERPATRSDLREDIPELSASGRVHARGRFVQKDERWISNKGHGSAEFSLIAATAKIAKSASDQQ